MMNRNAPEVGLRRRPLWHFLNRGPSLDVMAAARELEELRAAQVLPVVPLALPGILVERDGGKGLRRLGLAEDQLISLLDAGVEIIRVDDDAERKLLVGLIDNGRFEVSLEWRPFAWSPADWTLSDVEKYRPKSLPTAKVNADWRSSGVVDGDNAEKAEERWLSLPDPNAANKRWPGTEVAAGTLALHVAKNLQERHDIGKVLGALTVSRLPLYVVQVREDLRGSQDGLTVVMPDLDKRLSLFPAQFPGATPADWMLRYIDDDPQSGEGLPRLATTFRRPRVVSGWPADPVREARAALADRENWIRDNLQPTLEAAGPFGIYVPTGVLGRLARSADDIFALFRQGIEVHVAEDHQGRFLFARPIDADWWGRLEPRRSPESEPWCLLDIRTARSEAVPFARLEGRWRFGPTAPPMSPSPVQLLADLKILRGALDDRQDKIRSAQARLDGVPGGWDERVRRWRKVCGIERNGNDLGVESLFSERVDGVWRLVPKKADDASRWLQDRKEADPQGVAWDRHRLEYRVGNHYAKLTVFSPAPSPEATDFSLVAKCCDARGNEALRQAADSGDLAASRLLLPDTQLRQIERALDLLHLESSDRRPGQAVMEGELRPDDQTLRTLQLVLDDPSSLPRPPDEWPGLPTPPLTALSPAQERAVRAALFGADATLIQGPPGTGKTTVILEILRQLFLIHGHRPEFRVLLVAPTHVAVDNVLERLLAPRVGGSLATELGVTPCRVGGSRKIAEEFQGMTPDCFQTDDLREMSERLAADLRYAKRSVELDREMLGALRQWARGDVETWSAAAKPEASAADWPAGLDAGWRDRLTEPSGRADAWRHWAKIGNAPERRVHLLQDWHAHLARNPEFFKDLLLAQANLVCATTIGCATKPGIQDAEYDYVIVDEAGKEETRRLLVPLVRGERWILVGDHRQLPPYADDKLKAGVESAGMDATVLTRSLFEELQPAMEARGSFAFLDRQGRMHPDISTFVSRQFYDGRLHDMPHVADLHLPGPFFLPDRPALAVIDTGHLPDYDRLERPTHPGFDNPSEAELAGCVLRAFADHPDWSARLDGQDRPDRLTIAVIAPYRDQVETLTKKIKADPRLRELHAVGAVKLGTVDSFQGQERDLVLFSCTRSNRCGNLGFVDNFQRLNVALSRGRRRLVVLADGSTVECARHRAVGSESERENRDCLDALFRHAKESGGLVEAPIDWRQCWGRR